MRTYTLTLFALVTFLFQVQAQIPADVIRLSQHYFTGSARATAMGGAFGSLGADVSAMSLNPAGLGMYRTSELVFTPGVSFNKSKSTFLNSRTSDDKVNFFFNNLAYVATSNIGSGPWESFSLGIGYQKLADFTGNTHVYSPAANSSLLDEFVYYSNMGAGSPAYEDLAYNTYLLGYDEGQSGAPYFSDYDDEGYGQTLSRTLRTRGGIGEFVVSAGGNMANKFYLGASMAIHDVDYKATMDHKEFAPEEFEFLDGFWFTDYFRLSGWGFNMKLGAIYRPLPELRLGLAVHTPTWYDLDASQETYMDAYFKKDPALDGEDVPTDYADVYYIDSYGFKIHSPFRFITSFSYQFGEIGLVSVDYEWVDYESAKLKMRSDPGYAQSVNDDIKGLYQSGGNLRVGAEVRAGITSFRAGYAYYGSPDASSYYRNQKQQSFSGGLGWKFSDFYIDLAYVCFMTKENVRMYETQAGLITTPVKSNSGRLYTTVGFKF